MSILKSTFKKFSNEAIAGQAQDHSSTNAVNSQCGSAKLSSVPGSSRSNPTETNMKPLRPAKESLLDEKKPLLQSPTFHCPKVVTFQRSDSVNGGRDVHGKERMAVSTKPADLGVTQTSSTRSPSLPARELQQGRGDLTFPMHSSNASATGTTVEQVADFYVLNQVTDLYDQLVISWNNVKIVSGKCCFIYALSLSVCMCTIIISVHAHKFTQNRNKRLLTPITE